MGMPSIAGIMIGGSSGGMIESMSPTTALLRFDAGGIGAELSTITELRNPILNLIEPALPVPASAIDVAIASRLKLSTVSCTDCLHEFLGFGWVGIRLSFTTL